MGTLKYAQKCVSMGVIREYPSKIGVFCLSWNYLYEWLRRGVVWKGKKKKSVLHLRCSHAATWEGAEEVW